MRRTTLALLLTLIAVLPDAGLVGATAQRDASCAEDVRRLNEGSYQYGDIFVSWLTGCARTVDGEWIWPDEADDPGLVSPWQVSDQQAVVVEIVAQQVGDLWKLLDRTPYWTSEFPTWGAYFRWLDEGERSGYRLGVADDRTGPATKGFALDSYRNLLVEWLQSINAIDLMYFVQAWEQAKMMTIPSEVLDIINGTLPGNRVVAISYFDAMGFWRTPWPWELESPYLQAWFANKQIPGA